MPKCKIPITYPKDGRKDYAEVRGYPISIPWLDGINFFAHHPYPSGMISYWNISEAKTGLALITYCRGTKEQAVDALKSKLANVKTANIRQHLLDVMKKAIVKDGIVNEPLKWSKGVK